MTDLIALIALAISMAGLYLQDRSVRLQEQ